jgi:methionyl-tRNA synthetase
VKAVPAKDPVTFDDFTKVDIRTATILEAEKIPKTTKLLKLKIDTGIDIRTIVSGIAEYFEPQDIIGKQISIVANLEPRMIRGIESKGMILMAEDSDGKLVLVSPSEKVNNGSLIK